MGQYESLPLAHMTAPGMGNFASGLLHPWMTPTHVLVLLALGLWLGQHVPLRLGMPCKVFAPLSAVALLLTTTGWVAVVPPPILLGIALVTAAVVALESRLPSSAGAVLLAVAAVAIGLDSAPETTSTPSAVFSTLAGTWVGLGLGLVNLAYYVSLAAERKRQWIRIGFRVVGSWIFAISLLMLAFALRRPPAG
ncbi:MAG: HupE/UreJ family protein [Chthoniobacter sp.]|nr:HupE/UreJ family protein [Chthoniobacter sp.]